MFHVKHWIRGETMDFTPDSNIYLLSGVPLDNTYRDTLTFPSVDAQFQYFSSKVKRGMDYSGLTYQRIQRAVRVPANAEQLWDVNYMMFQNRNYGDRWFYAFVTDIQYVSPETSYVFFEVDDMQSWVGLRTIHPSMVEREHVNDDTIGLHTLPENLETGPYVTTAQSSLLATDLSIYIMATDENNQPFWNDPGIVGGFPVSTYWASLGTLSNFSVTVLKLILENYAAAGKADAIVAVFTGPTNMISTERSIRQQSFNGATRTLTYTPKNNKLYVYPYCSLVAATPSTSVELRYENFSSTPKFSVIGGFGSNPQIVCSPMQYENQPINIPLSISIKDWPICAWVTNYYQNWLAQNKVVNDIGLVNATFQAATSAATVAAGNVGGINGVMSAATQAANILASEYQHSIIPDKMHGSANAGDILAVSGQSGFYTYCRTIKPEYAKIIDDFWNLYGYKVNTVKVPNITGRPHWNYVKTQNAMVTGSCPFSAISHMRNILNNGITYWHNPNEVGNYELDNSLPATL